MQFNLLTPLYHPQIDSWGFATGTRVWKADGSFEAVQKLNVGDPLFGITYRMEDMWVPRSDNNYTNLVKVWRPLLCERKILKINIIEARSWQLTFGDTADMSDSSRRLVAGADTVVSVMPFGHDLYGKRMHHLTTALPNPRVSPEYRDALELDEQKSEEQGHPVYRETWLSGQSRGDLATIIPYDAMGGQMSMITTGVRPYERYVFKQIREVIPLQEKTTLYQIYTQPDTKEEAAASRERPRANLIAQTPFQPDTRRTRFTTDAMAESLLNIHDIKEFNAMEEQWWKYVQGQSPTTSHGQQVTVETAVQGTFYETLKNEKLLSDYGIKGGWLNGGILIDIPPLIQ